MKAWLAACVSALALACGAPASDTNSDSALSFQCVQPTTLHFLPDTGSAPEAYLCFGFDATALAGATLSAVLWNPPDRSAAMQLHHATLYALPEDYPAGPSVCDAMPDSAVGLHIWSVGGSNLELPSDTALRLPPGTRSFAIQAHTANAGSGPLEEATVTLCRGPAAPAHLAAFFGYSSPVPAIRPMHVETSQGSCALGAALHLWSVWPHMHLAGREVSVDLARADGAVTPLVDVNPWSFHQQRTYPLSVDAEAGDTLRTQCTWQNDSESYILPGPRTEDEMCTTGFVAWPAEAARCQ